MEDLSLHVLDVAENALAAGADRIEVRILEESRGNTLSIEIKDNGFGMDEETASLALDPFYSSKPGKRVGLGLPLLAQAAGETGGSIEIKTMPGQGTVVRATFRPDHPDLKPMGDMLETMAALACAHPQVAFVFEHRRNCALVFHWNSGSEGPARTKPW